MLPLRLLALLGVAPLARLAPLLALLSPLLVKEDCLLAASIRCMELCCLFEEDADALEAPDRYEYWEAERF